MTQLYAFSLLLIINAMYIRRLREIVLLSVQNIVGVFKRFTIRIF
jgi:hypothetical protein